MLTLTQLVVCHKEFLKLSFSLLLFIMLSVLLLFSSYCIMIQQENVEKISAYECGFQPFEDTRIKFDVRYYLVGILFPISDPEIMFLFP